MEFIKKTILQSITTGTTATTSGNKYIIIPDTGVTYHIKICLESIVKDIGFFDAYDSIIVENNEIPPTTLESPEIPPTTTLEPTLPLIEYCYQPHYVCGDPIHEISGHEPNTGSIIYWDEYGNEHTIYGCRDEIDRIYVVNSSATPIIYGMSACD